MCMTLTDLKESSVSIVNQGGTYLGLVFFTRARGKTELIDAYVTDMKNRAKDCKFEQFTELLLRDRIMCGVANDQIRARLLRESDLVICKLLISPELTKIHKVT